MATFETGDEIAGCKPSKEPKLDEEANDDENSIHTNIKNLSDFKVNKILNNNTRNKIVCLQGTFLGGGDSGLVILEKTAFEDEQLKSNGEYFGDENYLKKIFHNDIYGNYEYILKSDLNCIKTTIIHPATDKHIQKYSVQTPYVVDETPTIYKDVVYPHITKEQFNLQWVYNILEHTSESERIVFEDPDPVNGFILLPDLKWNGTSLDTLYLLAIVNVRNIISLRDLTGEHLPLLKNVFEKGTKAIEDKYGLPKAQLRIYIHYQPSFYHLHIHFSYLRHEAPGILAERAHLLSNVISNIEIVSDYYQRATLPFVVREIDNLFQRLEEVGVLKKVCIEKSECAQE